MKPTDGFSKLVADAPRRDRGWRMLRAGAAPMVALVLLIAPAGAVDRTLEVIAPAAAAPQTRIEVTVRARTDAGAGEQVGFLHVEYSVDGGKTWTGLCYEQAVGAAVVRPLGFVTGAAGSKARVRARVAFRGGVAGDVDFNGAAIQWHDSWDKWGAPPARVTTTDVGGR